MRIGREFRDMVQGRGVAGMRICGIRVRVEPENPRERTRRRGGPTSRIDDQERVPPMNQTLRRIRGLLGTAFLWGAGWGGLTAAGALLGGDWIGALTAGTAHFLVGAVAGGTFAGLLALGERGRSLADLSPVRVAIWGATGGTLLAPLQYLIAPALGVAWPGLVGAGLAVGSLALARRAASEEALAAGTMEADESLEAGAPADERTLGVPDPQVSALDDLVVRERSQTRS